MSEAKKTVFETLNAINMSDKVEKKGGLSYLSWCWAWGTLKEHFPDSTYTVYENEQGWPYFTDGRTAWVKTGVTVNGKEYVERLPIMDYKNNAIPIDRITSMNVNTAIQRSITKAIARHGLGLYIYAGEDVPRAEKAEPKTEEQKAAEAYPERDHMIDYILTNLNPGQKVRILEQLHAATFTDLTDAQVMACYNWAIKEGAKNE